MHVHVDQRQRRRSDLEFDGSFFSGFQVNALKSGELFHRPRNAGDLLMNVQLGNFVALPIARIRHINSHGSCAAGQNLLWLDAQILKLEGRVT